MISYEPLWITLIKKNRKKSDLYAVTSTATVSRMGRNEYVSMEVIDKICDFLGCDIENVVRHIAGSDITGSDTEKAPDA
ncbi:MAG: helix-turn-helix transcriptional regulator [Oscillospiraceae bacterium]|nr:helix-turn-helix transcriptional regulator [Oscillospiraceae bacterium]